MTIRLGVIGGGRWGRNIAQTLRSLPDVAVAVAGRELLPPRDLDGVVIASPSATHAELALRYINAGVAALIEKPMATSVADAQQICAAAARSGAVVSVGHLHLHNPAFEALCELLPQIGRIRYITSQGANDRVRPETSVLWDWLPHDLSMAQVILGRPPTRVQAWDLSGAAQTEAAICRFAYADTVLASTVSWLSPVAARKLAITAERGTLLFDDGAVRKLALYDDNGVVSYPGYDGELPLTRELRRFIDTVRSHIPDSSQVELGSAIVRAIAAAELSLGRGGLMIDIGSGRPSSDLV